MNNIIHVNATQAQHTDAGMLLGKLYYSGFFHKVLSPEEHSGYPHNGGQHTLTLKMPKEDLLALGALIRERHGRHPGMETLVAAIEGQSVYHRNV